MTERIAKLKEFFIEKKAHHAYRRDLSLSEKEALFLQSLSDTDASAAFLVRMLDGETPVVFPEERIPFTRTIASLPTEVFAPFFEGKRLHEAGFLNNICVDYGKLIDRGLEEVLADLEARRLTFLADGQKERAAYLASMASVLNALLSLCDRYREEAARVGNRAVSDMLGKIPRKAPQSFPEALFFFRILHFTMWLSGSYHNTVGRFDLYMRRYYEADREKGMSEEEALEWLEEFFLTFNRDSDLYPGVQQGDNGQSLVLGGIDRAGNPVFSSLSALCLKASLELSLIDPKINLRVDRNTPDEIYELGTRLTAKGLGFPQYTNDDVVLKALENWGYDPADAWNYAIAACWEILIPGKGVEIPNVAALSFAGVTEKAVREHLLEAADFEELMSFVEAGIRKECEALTEKTRGIYILPSPFLSLMVDRCVEEGRDASLGGKYNNYGIHGAGLATAVDSLAAISRYVFERREVGKEELLTALGQNYEGYDLLWHKLRYEAPKFGSGDALPDGIASRLLASFAKSLSERRNDRGGIFRAGTGSAMYYITHGRAVGATPDGRRRGESVPANYSPSLFARCPGPVSVVKSFTRPDLSAVANGGPLTLELHDTMFRTAESVKKTALLVKSYIALGGHQLQLNAVNREALLQAQLHPENYRNLIVRVWGWSGYFVELDREYQDHIIARCEYVL